MSSHSQHVANEPSPHWLLASRVSLTIAAIGIALLGGLFVVFRVTFQRMQEDFGMELPSAVVKLLQTPTAVLSLILICALAALIAKEFLPIKRQLTTAINCVVLATVFVTGSVVWILLVQMWFKIAEAIDS